MKAKIPEGGDKTAPKSVWMWPPEDQIKGIFTDYRFFLLGSLHTLPLKVCPWWFEWTSQPLAIIPAKVQLPLTVLLKVKRVPLQSIYSKVTIEQLLHALHSDTRNSFFPASIFKGNIWGVGGEIFLFPKKASIILCSWKHFWQMLQ